LKLQEQIVAFRRSVDRPRRRNAQGVADHGQAVVDLDHGAAGEEPEQASANDGNGIGHVAVAERRPSR
jgi:hypothetical protein